MCGDHAVIFHDDVLRLQGDVARRAGRRAGPVIGVAGLVGHLAAGHGDIARQADGVRRLQG